MACLSDETVAEWLEGQLSAEDRIRAATHLDRCDECRQLVAASAEAFLSSTSSSPDNSPTSAPSTGTTVAGRFLLQEVLGSGATGIVFAARDQDLDRAVALKVLRRDAAARERKRFAREARIVSSLNHPAVVRIYDVLTTDQGHPVLVMERLEGETLRQLLIRERTVEPEQVRAWLEILLEALAVSHEAGIVHRDLKPENLFITSEGIKILDFGVAKLLERRGDETLTETGTLLGTPVYMAPEQAFGESDIDGRADLWSLGVIAYECLAGSRPIQAANLRQLLKELAAPRIAPLKGVPKPLARVVHGLLASKSQRPKSAAAARQLLGAATHRPRLGWWASAAASAALAIILAFLLTRSGAPGQAAPHTEPASAPTVATLSPVPAAAARASVAPRPSAPQPPSELLAPRPAVQAARRLPRPGPLPAPQAKPSTSPQPTKAGLAPAASATAKVRVGPGHLVTDPPF